MSSPASAVSSRRRRVSAAADRLEDAATRDMAGSPRPSHHIPIAAAPNAAAATATAAADGPGQQRQSPSLLGSSGRHREPIRSFINGSFGDHNHVPVDSAQNARSVRLDTAELASYVLSDRQGRRFRRRPRDRARPRRAGQDEEDIEQDWEEEDIYDALDDVVVPDMILELSEPSEPPSPAPRTQEQEQEQVRGADGPSLIANMLRRSPYDAETSAGQDAPEEWEDEGDAVRDEEEAEEVWKLAATPAGDGRSSQPVEDVEVEDVEVQDVEDVSEITALLRGRGRDQNGGYVVGAGVDVESQKDRTEGGGPRRGGYPGKGVMTKLKARVTASLSGRRLSRRVLWDHVVVAPVSCLPAVLVGLLLNILDALSYGMILFPLGRPIFSGLGSVGISIFYVSTIIAQVIFSSGSVFRGAVGSELIEVVPFFHSMALTITDIVGGGSAEEEAQQADAIIATTIVSYALSSILTGLVFYLMGRFRFGYMVGFIPRHILIGCIGGVGWFLVATGFEVSARLDGPLGYDLDTARRLVRSDTAPLWLLPLGLAVALFWGQARVRSKYFLPLYIMAIPVVFYAVITAAAAAAAHGRWPPAINLGSLRDAGWIFAAPPAGEPWWYFYTLYKFNLVRWDAVAQTIPAMLALTFFGILHVPINVPALALNCGEDEADLDHELRLHGYSNALAGLAGSVQNYLVYANTVFFMRSGGDRRLAGLILAGLTGLVMTAGPAPVGLIPVMMVGTLIFDLGFELLLEAVWLSRQKLRPAEYGTVLAIVLVMGAYDFVIGIGVGVLLAFVSLIVQAARVSPIRGSYSGDVVTSTVRRNPSQHQYLRQAGRQIRVVKLTGYLFFGTVVGVEERVRDLVEDGALARQPIRFLILDMWHVTGLDYSAGEAFNTISRLLDRKQVVLVLSGVNAESELGRRLLTAGLGRPRRRAGDGDGEGGGDGAPADPADPAADVLLLPDLNSALESCENELLKTLYYAAAEDSTNAEHNDNHGPDNPDGPDGRSGHDGNHLQMILPGSPRHRHLHEAAHRTIAAAGPGPGLSQPAWRHFREPLRLMLGVFHGLSPGGEDFWFPAASYFTRRTAAPGTILYRRGDPAMGFYLVERGMLRAEYDLPQGRLCESITAGTTCGELPFFSETSRTATVAVAEGEPCVLWLLDKAAWEALRVERAEVAQELLLVSLKLTSERMNAFTSYVLAQGG